jgi:hypothetical protein
MLSFLVLSGVATALLCCGMIIANKQYIRMLESSSTPICMRGGVAEVLLYLIFRLSTVLRANRPATLQARMTAAALEKIELLRTECPAIAPGGVCFIGSSTFTFWRHLKADMASLEVPVFNAAFGGSCTHDVALHTQQLCTQHRPQVVVYFCGTNNIAQGMDAASVLEGFELFLAGLQQASGSANNPMIPGPPPHVVFLGITLTPFFAKWNINNATQKVKDANRMVEDYCSRERHARWMTFVSTDTEDADSEGGEGECGFLRDPASYLGDLHHLSDLGHAQLAAVLLPSICSAITRYG